MIESTELARMLRIKVIEMSHAASSAHLASALSCIDLVAVLFHSVLNINPKNYLWNDRDRFILSKGHAATALYAAMEYKGFLNKHSIQTYAQKGSFLEEHPSPFLNGVEAASGSLGHGLSIACGMALAAKINGANYRNYVIMSDGECNEGSVWEACLFAARHKLDNLCAFVDFNKWQATGRTLDVMGLDPLVKKFESFGWVVFEIDGHNHNQILDAINGAKEVEGKPAMIVAHTIKGKGVSFMEDDNNWHYRIPSFSELQQAKIELGDL